MVTSTPHAVLVCCQTRLLQRGCAELLVLRTELLVLRTELLVLRTELLVLTLERFEIGAHLWQSVGGEENSAGVVRGIPML
jgi:hypothetical protein